MERFFFNSKPKKTSVYVHTNKDNEVLYVGISYKPLFRTHQHSKTKDWFEEVENIKIHWFKTREEAQKQERILIKKLAPKYNIQHNQVKVKNPPVKNMAGFNKLKAFRRDMLESITSNKNPHRHFLLINQAEKDAGLHRKWFHPYAEKNTKENQKNLKNQKNHILETPVKEEMELQDFPEYGFFGFFGFPYGFCNFH